MAITFGKPFDLAAAFSANASGLDFYPFAATAALTYYMIDGSGRSIPSAVLLDASVPEPGALISTLTGIAFLCTYISRPRLPS